MLSDSGSNSSAVHNDFQRRPPNRAATNANTNANAVPAAAAVELHHFKIPSVWKRCVAEFIDFMALFVIKLIVTFVAVDTFELIDLEDFMSRYDSSLVTLAAGKELDMAAALDLTSDIVFLEMIHRLVVCIFEAVCTYRGTAGSPGGATPGKLVMGLRIFKCDRVRLIMKHPHLCNKSTHANTSPIRKFQLTVTNDPQYVQITPGTDLGIFWASVWLISSVSVWLQFLTYFPHSRFALA